MRRATHWTRWVGCAAMGVMMLMLNVACVTIQREVKTTVSQDLVDAAIAKVKPALVRIHVVESDSSEGRRVKHEAAGSGVIVSPQGYVVTNHHVAGKAVRIWVTMPNREELEAKLIGTDPMADIAVLKIQPDKPTSFTFARWGDSSKARVGDPVLALGSPLALSQSVTRGIISNTEMIMPTLWDGWRFSLDGEDVGSIVRWLGHDAEIFPGNSGGPLVNLKGEIIGINEISLGLGGAIPGNLAREVSDTLIRDGQVARAYFGMLLQPLLKEDSDKKGVLIASVFKGSPAAQGGLISGDLLVAFNGEPVTARFQEEIPPLNLRLASLPIGKEALLTVVRGSEQKQLKVTPTTREKVLTPEEEFREWGITARNLSLWSQIEKSRATRDGVLVTSVRPGGPAGSAKPEIKEDDIIVKAGDIEIKNKVELTSATVEITKGHDEPVPTVVTFDRDKQRMITVVEVGIKDLEDPGLEVQKAWVPVETQVITRELAKAL
ncbi:MAG: trypsin-like peptidase domain-containing protein, partial [bacterium]